MMHKKNQEKIDSIAEKILSEWFKISADIDDIMESFQDFWLLSPLWDKVRKRVREITWKWNIKNTTTWDVMMKAWNTFSEYAKNYILSEHKRWYTKGKVKEFIDKNILCTKKTS